MQDVAVVQMVKCVQNKNKLQCKCWRGTTISIELFKAQLNQPNWKRTKHPKWWHHEK